MIRSGNVYIGSITELPNPATTNLKPGIIYMTDDVASNRCYLLKLTSAGVKKWVLLADNSDYSF